MHPQDAIDLAAIPKHEIGKCSSCHDCYAQGQLDDQRPHWCNAHGKEIFDLDDGCDFWNY